MDARRTTSATAASPIVTTEVRVRFVLRARFACRVVSAVLQPSEGWLEPELVLLQPSFPSGEPLLQPSSDPEPEEELPSQLSPPES